MLSWRRGAERAFGPDLGQPAKFSAMSSPDSGSTQREYHYVLQCPCGERLEGDTEDDIVDTAFGHLREKHPDMAETYERHHILFMSLRLPK